jgi:hypothetical protein
MAPGEEAVVETAALERPTIGGGGKNLCSAVDRRLNLSQDDAMGQIKFRRVYGWRRLPASAIGQ